VIQNKEALDKLAEVLKTLPAASAASAGLKAPIRIGPEKADVTSEYPVLVRLFFRRGEPPRSADARDKLERIKKHIAGLKAAATGLAAEMGIAPPGTESLADGLEGLVSDGTLSPRGFSGMMPLKIYEMAYAPEMAVLYASGANHIDREIVPSQRRWLKVHATAAAAVVWYAIKGKRPTASTKEVPVDRLTDKYATTGKFVDFVAAVFVALELDPRGAASWAKDAADVIRKRGLFAAKTRDPETLQTLVSTVERWLITSRVEGEIDA
jgi:hypothetical protein